MLVISTSYKDSMSLKSTSLVGKQKVWGLKEYGYLAWVAVGEERKQLRIAQDCHESSISERRGYLSWV